ncbi:MAG TPA: SRPBCC family protein, partial [Pyrinomonadaceae bacterium]|nr:SRPBCC family protein [Pyrinomonadaceae bacterium]
MAKAIEKWIEINAPPERVFNLFGAFENFPHWIANVREAGRLENRRALFRTAGGARPELTKDWEAQVTASDPPRHIAWRAAGSGVNAEVEAEFEETQRGTTL